MFNGSSAKKYLFKKLFQLYDNSIDFLYCIIYIFTYNVWLKYMGGIKMLACINPLPKKKREKN